MSVGFMVLACVFALVLSCAVACVDWWREERLAPRVKAPATIESRAKSKAKRIGPAAHRRAA